MATVEQSIKESLLGTTKEPDLSQQTRASFDRNAVKDENTGDLYLGEDEFVRAIAPEVEDYVGLPMPKNLHFISQSSQAN